MTKEFNETLGIVERIPPRDKEVILLATVFFWAKYMRRKINTEGYKPVIPKVDFNDPMSISRVGFDLHRQANSDIDGDIIGAVSNLISRHPMRSEIFPHLSNEQIVDICSELDNIFENQEFCAQCESWSYYDQGPEDFIINVTDTMLYLKGGPIGLSWFACIHEWKHRQPIIKAVVKEKLAKQTSNSLPIGKK